MNNSLKDHQAEAWRLIKPAMVELCLDLLKYYGNGRELVDPGLEHQTIRRQGGVLVIEKGELAPRWQYTIDPEQTENDLAICLGESKGWKPQPIRLVYLTSLTDTLQTIAENCMAWQVTGPDLCRSLQETHRRLRKVVDPN